MSSVLGFERHSADLNRQLLRRIGYTNGLHRIRRFARVVEYLYQVMPTSRTLLGQLIIDKESAAADDEARSPSGRKYVQGIVDVSLALRLVERFGPKLALSSEGYACHCLNVLDGAGSSSLDAFLFERVLACDGEYTLNVLKLTSEGFNAAEEIGASLIDRFLRLIEFKQAWAAEAVVDSFAKRTLGSLLADARRKLQESTTKGTASTSFFYRHTAAPRVEWLVDLGLITNQAGQLRLTASGSCLLDRLSSCRLMVQDFVVLPLDRWLGRQLNLPPMIPSSLEVSWSWDLCASAFGRGEPRPGSIPGGNVLIDNLASLYPYIKLKEFNEADVLSAFHVMAARMAATGSALSEERFEATIMSMIAERSTEVFKLTKRRGHGFYFAFKRPPK